METHQTNVLVVDDDPAVRHAVELRLSAAGFRVNTVACGEDALLACSPEPPDVMILDVSMPGMDGYQVCKRLREHIEKSVAVIFLTGTTHAGTTSCLDQMVQQSGGDYFLVKPYDAELLVELVRKVSKEAACEQPG